MAPLPLSRTLTGRQRWVSRLLITRGQPAAAGGRPPSPFLVRPPRELGDDVRPSLEPEQTRLEPQTTGSFECVRVKRRVRREECENRCRRASGESDGRTASPSGTSARAGQRVGVRPATGRDHRGEEEEEPRGERLLPQRRLGLVVGRASSASISPFVASDARIRSVRAASE